MISEIQCSVNAVAVCPACEDTLAEDGRSFNDLILPSLNREFETVSESCESCGATVTLVRVGSEVTVSARSGEDY